MPLGISLIVTSRQNAMSARHCHNLCLARAAAAVGRSPIKPLGEGAIFLILVGTTPKGSCHSERAHSRRARDPFRPSVSGFRPAPR
jgi:hypothetical protein